MSDLSDLWVDHRQDRRIDELQDEVRAAQSYAASKSRALQSRLSHVQGTLERRLERLAESFDAFVELSDLRLELAIFDRESAVRHRTRRLLGDITRGVGDPAPLGLDDCPEYWLQPAAEALSAFVRGDVAAGERFAAEAFVRDEERTALFLTLGLAAADRHADAGPWLAYALPSLGTTVTAVQRWLWTAGADGVFGEAGRAHVERRLTELLDSLPTETADKERDEWRKALTDDAPVRSSLPRELRGESALADPPRLAARLTRLRTRVEEALAKDEERPEADFSSLLTTLVDEGSRQERPLVARARELRQIIEQDGGELPPAWDAPAGETLLLLRGDLGEQGGGGARELATRVAGDWIVTIAVEFAEQASVRPPEEVNVRVHGQSLRIGAVGGPSLARAQEEIDRAAKASKTGERIGLAVTGACVVIFVLAVATGFGGIAALVSLGVLVGAAVWYNEWSGRRRAEETARKNKDRLARQAQVITDAVRQCQDRHREVTATAKTDLETILTLLT